MFCLYSNAIKVDLRNLIDLDLLLNKCECQLRWKLREKKYQSPWSRALTLLARIMPIANFYPTCHPASVNESYAEKCAEQCECVSDTYCSRIYYQDIIYKPDFCMLNDSLVQKTCNCFIRETFDDECLNDTGGNVSYLATVPYDFNIDRYPCELCEKCTGSTKTDGQDETSQISCGKRRHYNGCRRLIVNPAWKGGPVLVPRVITESK